MLYREFRLVYEEIDSNFNACRLHWADIMSQIPRGMRATPEQCGEKGRNWG